MEPIHSVAPTHDFALGCPARGRRYRRYRKERDGQLRGRGNQADFP
jgi:hypothetical protein